jgi:hypothetical protein
VGSGPSAAAKRPGRAGAGLCTLLIFAWATAYRRPCEREASGKGPVGWQGWRRQLLGQTRDKVIVFAQGYYGIFPLAEYSLLLGVRLKDIPSAIGSRQQALAKYSLPVRGSQLCWNYSTGVAYAGTFMSADLRWSVLLRAYQVCRQQFHHKRSPFPTSLLGSKLKRAKVELRYQHVFVLSS